MSRVVVVISLEPGASRRVAPLIRQGPPFDPEAAGLERHHVFLTEREAVIVLEGRDHEAIERFARDVGAWSEWSEHAAAPQRVAEDVYDWIRPEPRENVVYTSTPGPGDSDGGDLYSP